MSTFTILEMNRSKDIQRLDDPAHTWHTCYASVKEGTLRVWPLVNKFVARHIGDSGMQLLLSPEDGKWFTNTDTHSLTPEDAENENTCTICAAHTHSPIPIPMRDILSHAHTHTRAGTEFEIDLRDTKLSFFPHRTFQSATVFQISAAGCNLYCCTTTHMEFAWWQKALQVQQ